MAQLEDTNLLWRGGRGGLAWAQAEASAFLAQGGIDRADWRSVLAAMHTRFVARRLSPGGSADLVACADFLLWLECTRPESRAW
jgi:triphosphoribosyl-dephospho-CoA synthase